MSASNRQNKVVRGGNGSKEQANNRRETFLGVILEEGFEKSIEALREQMATVLVFRHTVHVA